MRKKPIYRVRLSRRAFCEVLQVHGVHDRLAEAIEVLCEQKELCESGKRGE